MTLRGDCSLRYVKCLLKPATHRVNDQVGQPIYRRRSSHDDVDVADSDDSEVLLVDHERVKVDDEVARDSNLVGIAIQPALRSKPHNLSRVVVSELSRKHKKAAEQTCKFKAPDSFA